MKAKFETVLLTCFCFITAAPAKAEYQQQRRIVTTGPVQEVQGWEKNLCGGDRNLGKWFWIPIRKQPINIRYEGENQNVESRQAKPEYVQNAPSRSYRDCLPQKVMPYVPPKPMPGASSVSSNSSGKVSGTLIDPSVSGKLLARQAPATGARINRKPAEYSYGHSYNNGAVGSSSLEASSRVAGRLLRPGS